MLFCGPGFAGGRQDPVAGLVLCAPSLGWVDLSVINGEIIVRDGKLVTVHVQVSPQIYLSFCEHLRKYV